MKYEKQTMKKIKTTAIISSIHSKVDRSLSLNVHTPELSTSEKVLFMELQGLNIDLTITPLDEPAEDYKVEKDIESKTPSQRLRNVLYILWKQQGNTDDFDTFYRHNMEVLITHYKSKLEK